jgi:effector-binding domain-containing protein
MPALVPIGEFSKMTYLSVKALRHYHQLLELPAADLAVMAHVGPFDELDRTYGALGTHVTTAGIAARGPIRETYLADDRAEVAWPINQR